MNSVFAAVGGSNASTRRRGVGGIEVRHQRYRDAGDGIS